MSNQEDLDKILTKNIEFMKGKPICKDEEPNFDNINFYRCKICNLKTIHYKIAIFHLYNVHFELFGIKKPFDDLRNLWKYFFSP